MATQHKPAVEKNAAAVELARLRAESLTPQERSAIAQKGGLKGGAARAAKLTPEQRSAIARKAAEARWGTTTPKKKKKKGTGPQPASGKQQPVVLPLGRGRKKEN